MERSQGSGSAACVRFWGWAPKGARGKGRHSRQWRLSMPAFLNRNKRRNAAPIEVAERPESPPGRLRRGESLCDTWKARKALPLPSSRNLFLVEFPIRSKGPKVSKGRPESPLVASAEAKPFAIREKKGRPFSCLPQAVCFLWEVSSACGRTRYFPSLESTQRVPGAAKGCMRRGRPRTPRC